MLLFVVIFCVMIALGFGLASAWSDFRGLTISNYYSLFIAASFVPAFLAVTFLAPETAYFSSWKSHLLSGGIIFALTFFLFSIKMIGAGDSKLSSVYALWIGMQGLPSFLFFMTLCGAILGLTTLIFRKWKPFKTPREGSWIDQAQKGNNAVPYGIAITFGAIIAFNQAGYFDPDNLALLAKARLGFGSS